jgi:hypothetical protein
MIITICLLSSCRPAPLEIIPIRCEHGGTESFFVDSDSCYRYFPVKNYYNSVQDRDSIIEYLKYLQASTKSNCSHPSYSVVEYEKGIYDEKTVYSTIVDCEEYYAEYGIFDIEWFQGRSFLHYNYQNRRGKDFELK